MNGSRSVFQTVVDVASQGRARATGPTELDQYTDELLLAENTQSALELISRTRPELVILRVSSPEEGTAALNMIRNSLSAVPPMVVVEETPNIDTAVRCIRAGAYDYIGGPLNTERLRKLAAGIAAELSSKVTTRKRYFHDDCPHEVNLAGLSPAIIDVLEIIRLVADSRCNPILIVGKTGTGKELAAKAIHAWRSGEAEKFVAVNCAALSATLLESELFGHVKGAFTGADRDKTGLFELAGDGSILLDEISEMDSSLQAKLLRILQEKTFRKVGGTKDITCDATIIATSNRDLLAQSRTGGFRQDLYYRLAVLPIQMPSLAQADRAEDITLLAEYFIEQFTEGQATKPTLSPEARNVLVNHDWPGNVRELRNVIERALILEKTDKISLRSLQLTQGDTPTEQPTTPARPANDFSLQTAEREFILRALRETGWQRTRAAALLGITRATLHAKLKRYEITPPKADSPLQ